MNCARCKKIIKKYQVCFYDVETKLFYDQLACYNNNSKKVLEDTINGRLIMVTKCNLLENKKEEVLQND